jgi:signal transduction histidine kinase
VEAERARAEENLELQRRARDAELAAQKERDRIARDIHDGVAQSIYALSLNLETCADAAEKEDGVLREQVRRLIPLAKKTLLETRHYIYNLKPFLSGERDLKAMAENQAKEFQTVSGTLAELSTSGEPREVSVAAATGLYRILQEALANVLKHAEASQVRVGLDFDGGSVRLSVEDDGVGIDTDGPSPGFGLENMRQRAAELAGTFEISRAPGRGTTADVTLPVKEVTHEAQ